MEEHQSLYMKMNYPKDWQQRKMSEYDIKSANLINKIKEKYKNIYSTRPHTILLDEGPLIELKIQPKKVMHCFK